MTSVDKNVTTLNEFVRLQLDVLIARGESSSDVMVKLFKGSRQVICNLQQTKEE